MVNNTGIKRSVVDIGWEAGAVASFGSAIGLTFFIFGLLVEIILFATRITKVFMPSNLWNNFIFMLWGTLAFYVTHDWWLSLGLLFFMLLYTLLFAEIQADRWSTYYCQLQLLKYRQLLQSLKLIEKVASNSSLLLS